MTITEIAGRDDRAAVEKALSILGALGEGESVGVSTVARRTGLSKSTAFRHLATLERNHAVVRVKTEYRIGPLIHRLAVPTGVLAQDVLRDTLTPFLVDLYEQTHEMVHLAMLRGTDVMYLNKLHGHRRIDAPSRIGGLVPAYATAVGKVMLSRNPKAHALVLAAERAPLTPATIVSADDLLVELTRAREQGIAIDRGESHPDLMCVAAPIITPGGQAVAALSVAGPRGLFEPETHTHILRTTAFAASRALSAMSRRLSTRADHSSRTA